MPGLMVAVGRVWPIAMEVEWEICKKGAASW